MNTEVSKNPAPGIERRPPRAEKSAKYKAGSPSVQVHAVKTRQGAVSGLAGNH